ncbi:glycosyltransferase family 2 protein [Tessaracoccus sp. MC1627]|uniref:glycosyltransferase family 2 protein n=1 Tax=Tessaracoccus sp. MC1627 TaxID=2760312 RepID=UPI0016002DF0|nr:glycosyltransferase family 2 protein [Tessaracoccus sp. MC1627]MBB1513193.1 glycosyltransferase family 2 protein [Tessaracoccus sp. MC1627]MBB1513474.1 glycosyltransferase family 2 protein [Tessaracoccus sp. MC1627]
MNLLSVVIPHYGAPEPTLALVNQLTDQAGPLRLEIIVSDDCSPVPFPPSGAYKLVRRTENGGFGSAVNSGAAVATGDYLLILNSDLEIDPTFISSLIDASAPWQPAVTAPRVVTPAGRVDHTARSWPSIANQTLEWLTPLARWHQRVWFQRLLGHNPRTLTTTQPVEVDWLVGAAFLVPTADFRAVGGMDESFHMNSEEIDLQRRLAARGLKRVYLPAVSVVHEGGGSSDPAKRRCWLVTSQLRYAEKWGGLRRLRVALTVATFINFAWNSIRRLRGIDVQPLTVAREELSLVWTRI